MNRTEILKTAEKYVSADRNQQYGEPEDNFSLIAEYWSVYIGDAQIVLDAFDVAMMMALMKFARLSKRPTSPDSAVDLAGYAACAGEILEGTRRAKEVFADQVSPPEAVPVRQYAPALPVRQYAPADPKILKDPADVI